MFDDLSEEGLKKLNGFVNNKFNPVLYLSIDPGKSNGVCGYDSKFYLQFITTIPATGMVKFLDQFHEVQTCILEDYRLYNHKLQQQVNSDMETSRVIGRVESWAELEKVKLVKQGASVKPTGYAWAGLKPLPKSNPLNHSRDAHIHFIYWGVKNKKINPATLLTMPKKETE